MEKRNVELKESATPSQQPSRQLFTNALLRAALTTVLAFSVTVMTHGLLSLVLDRDVIPEAGANALVVISMGAISVIVVFFATLSALTPERRGHGAPGLALLAGIGVFALTPIAGGLAYAIATGRLLAMVSFAANHLLSPFVLATAIIAVLTILSLPLLSRIRSQPR